MAMGTRGGLGRHDGRDITSASPRWHGTSWLTRHAVRLAREMQAECGLPAEVTDLVLVHSVMAMLADRLDVDVSGQVPG
jgi:hypothetical protein